MGVTTPLLQAARSFHLSGANGAVWVRLTWASHVQANRSSGRPGGCPSSRMCLKWPTYECDTCKLREDTQNHEMPKSSEQNSQTARTAASANKQTCGQTLPKRRVVAREPCLQRNDKWSRMKNAMCAMVQVRQWHFLMHWLHASTSGSLLLQPTPTPFFSFYLSCETSSAATKKMECSSPGVINNLNSLGSEKKKSARSPHDCREKE